MFRRPRAADARRPAGREPIEVPATPSPQPATIRHLHTTLAIVAFGALATLLFTEGGLVPNYAATNASSSAPFDPPGSLLDLDSLYAPASPGRLERRLVRADDEPFPFIWPVEGWITDLFDGAHAGVDVGFEGSPEIHAARGGTVTFVGGDPCCGKGLYVVISHGGIWTTVYGHLSDYYVRAGQKVARGQAIGVGGSTGDSTGPHLHLELHYYGLAVDPRSYFPPNIEVRLEPDATATPTTTGTPGPPADIVETPTPRRPRGNGETALPSASPPPTTATPPPTATPGPTAAAGAG